MMNIETRNVLISFDEPRNKNIFMEIRTTKLLIRLRIIHFRNTIRVKNCLDPDKDRRSVGPDLGLMCLQKLSADDKSRRHQGKRLTLTHASVVSLKYRTLNVLT